MLITYSLLLESLDQFLFWLAPQKRHGDYCRGAYDSAKQRLNLTPGASVMGGIQSLL